MRACSGMMMRLCTPCYTSQTSELTNQQILADIDEQQRPGLVLLKLFFPYRHTHVQLFEFGENHIFECHGSIIQTIFIWMCGDFPRVVLTTSDFVFQQRFWFHFMLPYASTSTLCFNYIYFDSNSYVLLPK